MADQAERQATEGADAGARRAFRRREPRDFDFSRAPTFRKTATLDGASIEWATGAQPVVTVIRGVEETRNLAKPGDAIVTGAAGERYVIDARRFAQLYRRDPSDGSRYVSTSVVRALRLTEATELLAPWGEAQRVEAGGFAVQPLDRPDDVYLIDGRAFADAYAPFERAG